MIKTFNQARYSSCTTNTDIPMESGQEGKLRVMENDLTHQALIVEVKDLGFFKIKRPHRDAAVWESLLPGDIVHFMFSRNMGSAPGKKPKSTFIIGSVERDTKEDINKDIMAKAGSVRVEEKAPEAPKAVQLTNGMDQEKEAVVKRPEPVVKEYMFTVPRLVPFSQLKKEDVANLSREELLVFMDLITTKA